MTIPVNAVASTEEMNTTRKAGFQELLSSLLVDGLLIPDPVEQSHEDAIKESLTQYSWCVDEFRNC
jgi:hypothetical protein